MNCFALTPQDAWFFRDGRPYNHGESNQADVQSVFPPPARTLTGALRAALARANGWNGRPGQWPATVTEVCGDGPHNLGQLQFTGPFLIRTSGAASDGALWPLPRHVLGRSAPDTGRWTPQVLLRPSEKPTLTDQPHPVRLPEIPLPASERDGLKPAESAWVTRAGFNAILAGRLPGADAVFKPRDLWRIESRVGLKRDATRLVAGEGDLYSPSYVRLCRHVALGMGLTGVPNTMQNLTALFPLGGESRLAHCEPWDGNLLPAAPPADSSKAGADGPIHFCVVLLTPGRFTDPAPLLSRNARTISACIGKPQFIGGWDSLKNQPLPLEPFHPPGSIWFCEAPHTEFPGILARHGQWLGDYIAHGFGQIVIGHWPASHSSPS